MSCRHLFPLLLLPGLAGGWLWHTLADSPSAALTGIVQDASGPVAGALVRLKGAATAVRTDAAGRFRLGVTPSPAARVTAWKEGYLIAGAPASNAPLVLSLHRLPAADNEDYAWVDPTPEPAGAHNCGNCHAAIVAEWSASGHAEATTNRRFRNLYDGTDWHGRPDVGWSLRRDHPDGVGVCSACHAPGMSFADPAYYDLTQARGVDRHGVHCDYCHKVAAVEPRARLGTTHGRFGLQLLRPNEGQLFFGPLADVDRNEDAYSRLFRSSRYCASCHEGTVFGVHVYATYSEWQQSPAARAGKQCQDCHMAPTGKMTNLAPGRGGIPRDPRTLANHRMFAGTQEEMLRASLRVEGRLVREARGTRVLVDVSAVNVGHRVPTGFIDRNLVLVVEGIAAGEPTPLVDGPTLPPAAGPALAGRPGFLFARMLTDADGHGPTPFWRARPGPADTRLAPDETRRFTFTFGPSLERVRVRLLYRRFWPEVAEAKGWPDQPVTVLQEEWGVPASP